MSQNSGQAMTAGRVTVSLPTDTERSSLHNSRLIPTAQQLNLSSLVHTGGTRGDVGGGVGNGVGGGTKALVGRGVTGGTRAFVGEGVAGGTRGADLVDFADGTGGVKVADLVDFADGTGGVKVADLVDFAAGTKLADLVDFADTTLALLLDAFVTELLLLDFVEGQTQLS
jgi:hypothetical protein